MFFNPVENILDPDAKFIFCVQLTWKTLQITDILPFLQSLVPADAVWSRGDNGRPARAHMVVIRFVVEEPEKLQKLQEVLMPYDVCTVIS